MMRLLCGLTAILFISAAPKIGIRTENIYEATEKAKSYGYVSVTHQAVTEDGYVLTMQRIPFTRYETSGSADRPVVFMMHGLYGSSTNFLHMGPEHSIGYHLADAGFDVWLGNARGNINTRTHTTFNLNSARDHAKFFNFSWEEIGTQDLPAMIDYVLIVSGQEKLHYIGHSQGGTVFLVLGSMKSEYNDRLASCRLLAGIGYQNYFPNSFLKAIAIKTDNFFSFLLNMGLIEVVPEFLNILVGISEKGYRRSDLCFGDIKYQPYCDLIGMKYLLRDDDPSSLNVGVGGGSLKQIAHFGQNIRDKQFRRYHYGTANRKLYGYDTPPLYELGIITANVTMHYTVGDYLQDERDVLAMAADMPNAVVRKVARKSFEHSDFISATDAKVLVTDYIIEAIQYVQERDNEEVGVKEPDVEVTITPMNVCRTCSDNTAISPQMNFILELTLTICAIFPLFWCPLSSKEDNKLAKSAAL